MQSLTLEQIQDLEHLMILWYGANHKELTAEQKKAYLVSHAMVETTLIARKLGLAKPSVPISADRGQKETSCPRIKG